MKEIEYKDIINCIGRKITLENHEGKKVDIHITSVKGDVFYGTGVGKRGTLKYEGDVNFKGSEIKKVYV